ncbi:MAG: hypothetical protein WCG55_00015 [bacterium]
MTTQFLTETAGWIGTGLVVLAYVLVSTKRVHGTSVSYQLLNLFGAIGVGANVLYQHAIPSFVLQAIWACIALFALINAKLVKKL